ncbi:hypothetical protein DPMN_105191 [Dreissena polymorpha]|uniref:Uncharacterized protein n=1 Tax=Dreissena polymorpha TaxID=45954 RepID=A0A9D4K255_DREPO|nr:hypothetical protein DPMN_105191 [Dreissena polymorpha]
MSPFSIRDYGRSTTLRFDILENAASNKPRFAFRNGVHLNQSGMTKLFHNIRGAVIHVPSAN